MTKKKKRRGPTSLLAGRVFHEREKRDLEKFYLSEGFLV